MKEANMFRNHMSLSIMEISFQPHLSTGTKDLEKARKAMQTCLHMRKEKNNLLNFVVILSFIYRVVEVEATRKPHSLGLGNDKKNILEKGNGKSPL